MSPGRTSRNAFHHAWLPAIRCVEGSWEHPHDELWWAASANWRRWWTCNIATMGRQCAWPGGEGLRVRGAVGENHSRRRRWSAALRRACRISSSFFAASPSAAWLEKEGGSGREQGGRSRGGPGRFWNLDPNRCPRRQTTRLNQTGDRTTEIRRQRGLTCARFGRKSRVKFRLLKIVHFEI